jgi:NitT/TauT family transport system substrate-binding protein
MKKIISWVMAGVLSLSLFAGCGASENEQTARVPEQIRVGSLKGPTSMGIANLEYEDYMGDYQELMDYTMVTQADELVTMLVKEELDIALVPANLASVLYNKTEGGVSVIDINTLGVLYVVECGDEIQSISDLAGKTLYMTGKGTTPDLALQYLLSKNDLTTEDLTIEYKSEATEVASILAEDETAIGLLPQPFVTTAMMSNDKLHIALDLTAEWNQVSDSSLLTGVTIVRNDFLEQYPDAVETFVQAHEQSVKAGEDDLEQTCARIEELGIIKAAVAKQAYEYCNIVCVTGDEMKTALSGYLQALYDLDPTSVGGSLPGEDFYKTF